MNQFVGIPTHRGPKAGVRMQFVKSRGRIDGKISIRQEDPRCAGSLEDGGVSGLITARTGTEGNEKHWLGECGHLPERSGARAADDHVGEREKVGQLVTEE